MKKFLFLLSGLCLGGPLFAQNVFEVPFGPEPGAPHITACAGTGVMASTFTSYTGYVTGETAVIDIAWGDGTTASQPVTFSCSSGACMFSPSQFSHVYATPGTFMATFLFTDTHGNTDLDSAFVTTSFNCGNIYCGVMLDTNNDGSGDVTLPNAMLDLTGAVTGTTTFTGNPITDVDVSDSPYTLSVNPAWLAANNYVMGPSSPTTQAVNFSGSAYVQLPGFLVTCDPANPSTQTDLAVSYMWAWGFRAGMHTGALYVNVCNYSCAGSQNADLDITFPSILSVYSHNIPGATVTGNVLGGNVNVNGCATYLIYFDVPGTTPAGTPLAFTGTVTPVGNTDFDLTNNTNDCVSEVRNSWDPNDKSVNKPEVISPAVREELTYVVRFQNMGNDDAFDIVIDDTLDTDLDLGTFTLLELSHNGSVNVDPATRVAKFSFMDINLPPASVNEPASHGYAIFKIKENNGLAVGTEIHNTAYIYFDLNPPIITNTTHNINQTSGVNEAAAENFSVYPVPADGNVVVASTQNAPIVSVKLVDVTGKTVLDVKAGGQPTYNLDIQHVASGAYTLVIATGAGTVNKKIVVR